MNQNVSYPNQTPARSGLYFCLKCDWENRGELPACPKCGAILYSQENIRKRGSVMVGLGFFLIIFMGALAAFVTKAIKDEADRPREWWQDDPGRADNAAYMLMAVYVIFGCMIASGFTAVVAGILQFLNGRRYMFLFWIFIGLFCSSFLLGGLFQAFDR
jgi:MFS family permease